MSGIIIKCQTKAKGALKLSNALINYLFEQEYDELRNCTPAQKNAIRSAIIALNDIVKNSK